MKLVKNKPVPPKFCNYRHKAMATKMDVGDCVEGCTPSEGWGLVRAITRLGFTYAWRKQNGSGVSVWKLGRKSK